MRVHVRHAYVITLLGLMMIQCTPKTAEVVEEPPVKEDPKDVIEEISGCETWNGKPYEEEAIETHVIYKDFMRFEEFDQAYPLWQKAFELAPMADGKRTTHFDDGVKFYQIFYERTNDSIEQMEWVNKLKALYDQMADCIDPAYASGRKAFDLYYYHRKHSSAEEIFNAFKTALLNESEKSKVFILNPISAIMRELAMEGKLSGQEAQELIEKMTEVVENGKANCEGKDCESWTIVDQYIPLEFERMETIKDFFDCNYYREKYIPLFEEDSANCDVIEEVYIRLRWGGCDLNDPKISGIRDAAVQNCTVVNVNETLKQAKEQLENGNYREAISLYEDYVKNGTSDPEKQAKYQLRIAKIYYAHLRNFPAARTAAIKAAGLKSGWGEPYILIGKLYASSGPLCGSGRGWNSQVVTWPAIDKWQYAKRIDPSVSAEANRLISRYEQYMPSKEDLHQRLVTEGSPYRVECWIQENTTIRAAK